jgi:hypothetical protein
LSVIIESGFRVELSPDKSFRFCDIPTYKSGLKRWSVSEMDFGYWDEERKAICLLELKDLSFKHPKAPAKDPKAELERFKIKIRDNIKDVLVMMHAAWSRYEHGKALLQELPEPFRVPAPIRLMFVMKMPEDHKKPAPPQSYKDAADGAARGYAKLLDLNATAVVLDQWSALALKLPISPL